MWKLYLVPIIPIHHVRTEDSVWDGQEWVTHEGIIDKGIQETVRISLGLEMTAQHRILTTKGWRESAKSKGLEWAVVPLPDGYQEGGEFREGAMRITVYSCGCNKQVYDLRNCGPMHRFAVWDRGAGRIRIVSNYTQAISRDILCHAMDKLEAAGCRIVMHIHDEVVIEATQGIAVEEVCHKMSISPPWADGLILNAAGYGASFYMKD